MDARLRRRVRLVQIAAWGNLYDAELMASSTVIRLCLDMMDRSVLDSVVYNAAKRLLDRVQHPARKVNAA